MINISEIIDWMKVFVEVKNKDFRGLSLYPYDKEVRLKNKIDFVDFPNDKPYSEIEQYIRNMNFDKHEVPVCIYDKERCRA